MDRKDFKHRLSLDIEEGWQFHGYEGWRPAMSLPLFVGFALGRPKCECGRKFRTKEDYYAHYLYYAIWKGESTVLPTEWKDLKR